MLCEGHRITDLTPHQKQLLNIPITHTDKHKGFYYPFYENWYNLVSYSF